MKNLFSKKLKNIVVLSSLLISAIACRDGGGESASNEFPSNMDVNMYSLNNLVCDPFDGGGGAQPGYGLKAVLSYAAAGQRYYTVQEYLDNGIRADQTIFFNTLNVPTRAFSLGFPTQTGGMLKADDGTNLVEFFALEFTTVLKLGPNDLPGDYELALLSDDGAILQIRDNGTYRNLVTNDGDHPSRFGCTTETVHFDADTEVLAKIKYYQGPRYHISLIPMWRRITNPALVGHDSSCGQSGNNMYFDPDHNSTPQAAYTGLLNRGWKPLEALNYGLPVEAVFNPCVNGQAPMISNVSVEDLHDSQLLVTWNTDILATSQVRIVNMDTGEEVLTLSDNMLRTEHEIIVRNVQLNVNYLVQAVSISETYGKSISQAFNVRLH
jgi:hypothetical protein